MTTQTLQGDGWHVDPLPGQPVKVVYDSANNAIGELVNGIVRRYPVQNAIPVFLQSSGTIGNNGALSALTALPTTYASAYLYFPVNTIAAGVAAGLYYCVMSSTTAGTIYNNTYDPSLGLMPTIPANPTAFVTTGPGAYVQTTGADITLIGCTIAGGSMGANGSLRVSPLTVYPNNANTKNLKVLFGGAQIQVLTQSTTTGTAISVTVRNRTINKQVSTNWLGAASAASFTPIYQAVDTTVDKALTYAVNLAVATDYIILEFILVELFYGA